LRASSELTFSRSDHSSSMDMDTISCLFMGYPALFVRCPLSLLHSLLFKCPRRVDLLAKGRPSRFGKFLQVTESIAVFLYR
jgi:hypothetical protein